MAPRRSTPLWPKRPAGAVRALSAFAGVPITNYVELRFEQLVELVDRLGGVTVNVPEGFTSDTSGITLAAGTQTLNGEEALAFARERHAVSSGDFSRAAAQRAIISAIADSACLAADGDALAGSLAACVTTTHRGRAGRYGPRPEGRWRHGVLGCLPITPSARRHQPSASPAR